MRLALFGYDSGVSLGDDFIKEHPELLEEASSEVFRTAEAAERELAGGEIAKYIAAGLTEFATAKAGDLDVQVWYELPMWAYKIRVRFRFNGYVYGVDRMLRDEDMEPNLNRVKDWRSFLDHELHILRSELWVGLNQNGITQLPKDPLVPLASKNEWFEARGNRQPRGAPTSAALGAHHTDLFGQVWVMVQGGWVTKEEARSYVVPSMAELVAEQNRVTKKEQDEALEAIIRSVRAIAQEG